MEAVVLTGEPGSGKSTVARELRKRIKGAKVIEASCIIYSASFFYPNLPDSAHLLLRKIKAKNLASNPPKVSRELARKIASKLQTRYSKDFVARALEYLCIKGSRHAVIIAGLRGYHNAKYLKDKGYFVVFLKATRSVLVRRLVQKYNYSKAMALLELGEENALHSTGRIEKIADLVVDTSKSKPAETALKVENSIGMP